jgi:hypothetical protein
VDELNVGAQNKQVFLAQTGSVMTVNNKAISTSNVNVKNLYRTETMKKNDG